MITKTLVLCLLLIASASALKVAHQGQYAWFTFNQTINLGKCTTNNQCDGTRVCSDQGECTGVSRPVPKTADYNYNETPTLRMCPLFENHKNYLNRDYYCDGLRKCEGGWCKGTSR